MNEVKSSKSFIQQIFLCIWKQPLGPSDGGSCQLEHLFIIIIIIVLYSVNTKRIVLLSVTSSFDVVNFIVLI